MAPKRSVLITGCSNGGLGAQLAKTFHARGLRVLATARTVSKMSELTALGIEAFELDIQSSSSIAKCKSEVSSATGGTLDILINNAGMGCPSTILDIDINEAHRCFDTNFFPLITVTQAFFPLLHEAKKQGREVIVANHTSISAGISLPTLGMYAASKAAAASLTNIMRLEFRPFGVKVIELRSGSVKSNVFVNQANGGLDIKLPPSSLYLSGKEPVEKALRGEFNSSGEEDAGVWANGVVSDLLNIGSRRQIWRGTSAGMMWFSSLLPSWMFDGMLMNMSGMAVVEKAEMEKQRRTQSNLSELVFV